MQINEEPMILKKYDQCNLISVWAPRYHDRKVLINPAKVGPNNKIVFPKAPALPGVYYLSGKTIKKYPKESNGTAMMYVVPVSELRPLIINEKDIRAYI